MKTIVYNLGYFIRETGKIIRLNLFSNLFSVLGTGLILFLLGLVITGSNIGNRLVQMLSEEAEINAYFTKDTGKERVKELISDLEDMAGVRGARLVDEAEAKEQMKELLGEEAAILELFDDNPFEVYVEIRIYMDDMDQVLNRVEELEGIDYVRDNREVLKQIGSLTGALKLLGYLMLMAVGITTIIILSHMIRQGIYNNRDQINTLRLLGAPSAFIGFPYLLAGLLLTFLGGLLAAGAIVSLINAAYGQIGGIIPFLPLPPKEELVNHMMLWLPALSLTLGFTGSLFGLSSIREKSA